MQHCDEADLACVALGEPATEECRTHLETCPACTAELEELRGVVGLARDDSVEAVAPPASVWAGIAAATGASVTPRPERVDAGVRAWSPAVPRPVVRTAGPGPLTAGPGSPAVVVPLRRARRTARRPSAGRRPWVLVGAVAASLVLGAAVGSGVTAWLDEDPAPVVIAATALDGLDPDPQATGEATVVRTAAGGTVLSVDASRLAGAGKDGFYEVWLIDANVQDMIPVGILRGEKGEFVLPDGIDLARFPVVDVSVEPLDGDPTHSGLSVLRGSIGT